MSLHRLVSMAALLSTVGCIAPSSSFDGDEELGFEDEVESAEDDLIDSTSGPLRFGKACQSGDKIVIGAVGDIMPHVALQRQAYSRGFSSSWGGVSDLLSAADVTYGNHEGPAARGVAESGAIVDDPGLVFDGRVYTGDPFNINPALEGALRRTGFDVVSTANNHSMDRFSIGVNRTLDAIDAAGLRHAGTRRRGSTGPWWARTWVDGFDIRWISCTYGTNIRDGYHQVLRCGRDGDQIEDMIRSLVRSGADAVIMTPHWGHQFSNYPSSYQISLAHRWLDAGATAVLGTHPHVLQPWEKYVTRDGRETFVMYSLGNFISKHEYPTLARRSSMLLYLGLTRGRDGRAFVNGVRYMPLYMRHRDARWSVVAIDRVGGFGDSRRLTTRMFGEWNVRYPWQPLVTNKGC